MKLTGKTIVITGAASGIGRALAFECAQRGASVALADMDLEGVQETRERVEADLTAGASCSAHQLDVGSLEQWLAFREAVLAEHGTVDGIINNAGTTFSGSIEDMTYEQLDRVMSVNFMGMVYGSKEFLDILQTRPEAFIANVSSVFGLFAMKNQGAYCASKFAIRGFTEVLAQELKSTGITVASIHPGHIGTDILKHAKEQGNVSGMDLSEEEQKALIQGFKALGMRPKRAAQIILDNLAKKKTKIMVGQDAVRGDALSRLLPTLYTDMVNRAAP